MHSVISRAKSLTGFNVGSASLSSVGGLVIIKNRAIKMSSVGPGSPAEAAPCYAAAWYAAYERDPGAAEGRGFFYGARTITFLTDQMR